MKEVEKTNDNISENSIFNLYLNQKGEIEKIKKDINELLLNDQRILQKIDQLYIKVNYNDEKRDLKIEYLKNMVEWLYRGLIIVFVSGLLIALWKWKMHL